MNAVTEQIQNPFANSPVVAAPIGAAAAAVVQREIAEVQAAMIIAQKFPRDERAAMDRILTACARESLAEAAVYQYSRGGSNISGPSIRLAEELARGWGNIVCGIKEVSRSAGASECLAYAWDLQTNFKDEKSFQVKHWRDTKNGGYPAKDERDIYEIIANQGARRKRACILAIIPGDVVDAAVHQCETTLKTKADVSPEALHKLVEAFAVYGVTKAQIEKRMQRRLDAMTPAMLVQFRKMYNSLKDGMSVAGDWFEPEADGQQAEETPAATRTETVKSKMKSKQAGEYIPYYSIDSAVSEIRSTIGPAELDDAWKKIVADFKDSNRPLPIDVEAAYNERKEFLK